MICGNLNAQCKQFEQFRETKYCKVKQSNRHQNYKNRGTGTTENC